MKLIKTLHVYFASYFWESVVSLPFYKPMMFYFADIDPGILDAISWIKYRVLRKKFVTKPAVHSVTVMNTFICNARCNFCTLRYNRVSYSKPFMELDLFKEAVEHIIELGIKDINLTPTVGEVLIDKGFFEKLQYAKKRGLKVYLHTNGYLLDVDDNYKKFVESEIDDLTISLSDLDPKYEAPVYLVSEAMAEQKVRGIRKILELNTKEKKIRHLRLHFRQSRHPHEITKNATFKEFREKYHFSFAFFFRIDNWGGTIDKKQLSKTMRLRKFRLFKKTPCNWLNNVCVHPDGLVRACGCRMIDNLDDDLVIGDITKEGNLKNVIHNGRLEAIKKGFTEGKFPKVCQNCTVYLNK